MKTGRTFERGASMAWTAMFFSFVLVPILIFVVDGTRAMRARTVLQQANDAACENYTYAVVDVNHFKETGEIKAGNVVVAQAQGNDTFSKIVSSSGLGATPAKIAFFPDANGVVTCPATMTIQLMLSGKHLSIQSATVSQARFTK